MPRTSAPRPRRTRHREFLARAAAATALTVALALLSPAPTRAQDPAPGAWGKRAEMIEANSEFALAEAGGKLYVLGGYPASRESVRTVQVYDIKSDTWTLGPPLPQVNNHGMAATVDGIVYLIGGQTDPKVAYVDTVYALDPKAGRWVAKARMPIARSAGAPVVLDGKIYVAGGRPPHGSEFAVYDPKADAWEKLPPMPTARNHIIGAAINGKVYVAGGRLGGGFTSEQTEVFEVYDPRTRTWSSAAPMPSKRSGHNGVVADGCLHVWGGEYKDGMYAEHDVYDPASDTWTRLADMPIPVHGVTGAAFVDGLIFVTGGGIAKGGSSGTRLNQVYRPKERCG